MGDKTKIGWTDHTFNPWWGCVKVSPGCENCYAERDSNRYGWAVWGPSKPRRFFTDKHWNDPVVWDRRAEREKARRRVFCASMADVFEDRKNLDPWRDRLWSLVEATPNLDWLLLTKRPENIRSMLRPAWLDCPRPNVWLGTTAEDQQYADSRIPLLLSVPARVHFVSAEPLLGALELGRYLKEKVKTDTFDGLRHKVPSLDWVIVGGESGPSIRPLQEHWVWKVVEDCKSHEVPVFVKQMGRVVIVGPPATVGNVTAARAERLADPKGGDPAEWPEGLRVREFPVLGA